jgi:hypothetical protein
VPSNWQDKPNSCWAAASLSVIQYYGEYLVTQAGIRDWATQGKDTANALYGQYIYKGVDQILSHYIGVSTLGLEDSLDIYAVEDMIFYERPIVIQWDWTYYTTAHIVTIVGLEGSGVYYIDPEDGWTVFKSIAWMQDDGSHVWSRTLEVGSPPSLPPPTHTGNVGMTVSSPIWHAAASIIDALLLHY